MLCPYKNEIASPLIATQNSIPEDTHLSHGVGQGLHNLLVGRGHNALAVDLDNAMADPDAPSLGYSTPHQAAYLQRHVCIHLREKGRCYQD